MMYKFTANEQKTEQTAISNIKNIIVRTHYFVPTAPGIDPTKLKAFLNADDFNHDEHSPMLLVLPRFGTLSPWSSKATDIINVSGIDGVERIEQGTAYYFPETDADVVNKNAHQFYDRMTQSVVSNIDELERLFQDQEPSSFQTVDILSKGIAELERVNNRFALALSAADIEYLVEKFTELKRNPTYTELMMFGQVNSEHCRHKIFNAKWTIDGQAQEKSLFAMIKNTYQKNSGGVLSAYHDNAAVIVGHNADRFAFHPDSKKYYYQNEPIHGVIKVETHNHPTAIAPYSGAATGAGGEIRDEGATGIGARPKAGLCGFSVSNLHLPDFEQPWEYEPSKPDHIASALDIMIHGPVGAAAFNNEFGRPNLCGYFRSFEQDFYGKRRGYHKPIMIAGGVGNIREQHIEKKKIQAGMKLIVLGGPAMQIGLGGGAASSMQSGQSDAELDFASVQRSNPEMERRCQQVINSCVALGENNPIVCIHDVGAGGLSNALPELVFDSGCGGVINLRAIPNADQGMSPLAIWCNEAQERYVLAVSQESLKLFSEMATRERCPFAVVGEAIKDLHLQVHDDKFDTNVVDLPLSVLFHEAPKLKKSAQRSTDESKNFDTSAINLQDAIHRVLSFPACASKKFLITIGDRSVTGLVARDQLVGPWQEPVADVAVTCSSYTSYVGEAMAMGERPPVALLNPTAATRLSVGEAITNIVAADVKQLSDIKLSANWMAAAGDEKEDADLYDAVHAIGEELCPQLGITIPVGKDSLSMRMCWQEGNKEKCVTSPLSLVISAFSPVDDVRNTLTPLLNQEIDSELWLLDLSDAKNRLGGSALAQVYNQLSGQTPDLDSPNALIEFFDFVRSNRNVIHAYHDRSDGGLFLSLCEMAFATHCGLTIDLTADDVFAELFSEEPGAVVQVAKKDIRIFEQLNIRAVKVAEINSSGAIEIVCNEENSFSESRHTLHRLWAETSYKIQALRDSPDCAQQEFDRLLDKDYPGLFANIPKTFSVKNAPVKKQKTKVAILREQGVNGHMEMAAAFDAAGFECVDVHMTDIISGQRSLSEFRGLAACGGFSYGDVLGAGRGWASAILFNARARDEFSEFFARPDTFALGVCNGCQMMSQIKALIPGAEHWPTFVRNLSNQFEARLSMVEIQRSPSILFDNMIGAKLPVVVSHGEGRILHSAPASLIESQLTTLRYLDNHGNFTEQYPENPNGSDLGITALCNQDGRFNIMMPHPERIFRTEQFSWHPNEWGEQSPWMQMFNNLHKI